MTLRIRKFIAKYFVTKGKAYEAAGMLWRLDYPKGSYGHAQGTLFLAWSDLMYSFADAFHKEAE